MRSAKVWFTEMDQEENERELEKNVKSASKKVITETINMHSSSAFL